MIIAVTGWRGWSNKSTVSTIIGAMLEHNWAHTNSLGDVLSGSLPLFRFGDCPTGVDAIMWDLVGEWHLPHERYEADWDQYGKAAGPLRNRAMLKGDGYTGQRAQLLLAFPEPKRFPHIQGSGAWGCSGEATNLGIPVLVTATEKPLSPTGYLLEVFSA